jgi:inositol-pentakisphosphate 2-kinase
MNALDWTYAAEGGKHVLFIYRPEENPVKKWKGQLLRLDKDDLFRSAGARRTPRANVLDGSSFSAKTTDDFHVSFRNRVFLKLRPYVELPTTVELEWNFVKDLRDQTLANDRVPSGRRKRWMAKSINERESEIRRPMGLLLKDYRYLSSCIVQCSESRCFSVEIKPKAGYRAFSPLVASTRTVKFLYSRFALLQRLWSEGRDTRDWMTEKVQVSSYDPADLFSDDRRKIRDALDSLLSCPQNHLKLWSGEDVVLGSSQEKHTTEPKWGKITDILKHSGIFGVNEPSFLIDMTCTVLEKEPFLQELLKLQKLDILDADGAIEVYNRLVGLCEGSHKAAEALVDAIPEHATTNPVAPHPLLAASPLQPPDDCSNIESLCKTIDEFAELLEERLPALPSQVELSEARRRASERVQWLSTEECVYLLQAWLLSLAMCDLSFFVTFLVVSDDNTNHVYVDDARDISAGLFFVQSLQNDEMPGRIVYKSSVGWNDVVFFYEVKAIDTDRKSAKKLRMRLKKEELFDYLQSSKEKFLDYFYFISNFILTFIPASSFTKYR